MPFTICIDSLHMTCRGHILHPESSEKDAFPISEEIALFFLGYGSPIFEHAFEIYNSGIRVGRLMAHPRKNKSVLRMDNFKIEVENNVLYTYDWYDLAKGIIHELKAEIQNVSRLDIAIDNLNNVHAFVNDYVTKPEARRKYKLLGKARLSAKIYDREKEIFRNFQVGSPASPKQITIYDKTSELEESNKTYIKDFWKLNNIKITEGEPVYRVELRLRGKALKEIRDFHLEACTRYQYLFELFKTECRNFFEFIEVRKDKNVSRAKRVKLLPHDFFKIRYLEKSELPVFDEAYKAKMTVHVTVKDYCRKLMEEKDAEIAIQHMKKVIEVYGLERWYENHIGPWKKANITDDDLDTSILNL